MSYTKSWIYTVFSVYSSVVDVAAKPPPLQHIRSTKVEELQECIFFFFLSYFHLYVCAAAKHFETRKKSIWQIFNDHNWKDNFKGV